jgi:hypothetical protein
MSIGEEAFERCEILTSIIIPDSVTDIRDYAFRNCSRLKEIKFDGTIEQWNNISKGSSWNYNVPTKKVICNDGEVEI